jgi:hypothetical protein
VFDYLGYGNYWKGSHRENTYVKMITGGSGMCPLASGISFGLDWLKQKF